MLKYVKPRVAELVDALASGASVRKNVLVRVQSRGPRTPLVKGVFLYSVYNWDYDRRMTSCIV